MTPDRHTPIPRGILQEACDWFVEFRAGDVDATARDRFDRWLRQSSLHIQAYLEIGAMYAGFRAAGSGLDVDVNALIAGARASVGADVVALGTPMRKPQSRTTLARPLLLAACVAMVVIGAGLLTWTGWRNRGIYSTAIGEQRSITLADGTIVDLNARTRIRVRFTRHERDIDLLQGQALFTDTRIPNDPFVVRSKGIVVRAIGTQFDVNQQVTGTVVTVLEGKVAVGTKRRSPPDLQGNASPPSTIPQAIAFAPILLSAGEQVTVGGGNAYPTLERPDLQGATAWRRHELVFDSSRLVDVVQEFNRYNRRQLVIESPALGDLEISGVYSSTDPASFLRFLRQQPGIVITETSSAIRIERH